MFRFNKEYLLTEAKEKPQGENHKHKHATPRKTYTSLGEVMSQGSPQAKALMGGAGDQGDAGDGDKLLQRTGKVRLLNLWSFSMDFLSKMIQQAVVWCKRECHPWLTLRFMMIHLVK